jgi:hypothetical protein
MGTPQHQPKVLLPGGGFVNPADFAYEDAVLVTVGSAGAAGDATSVPVSFSHPTPGMSLKDDVVLPIGTVLDFGGDKYATLTAAADPNADSDITVRALVTALVENDVATFAGGELNRKFVQSGMLVGRTYAERTAGTGYGPADVDTPDDQIFLLAAPITDALEEPYCDLYMHGNVVYENQLPGWSSLGATAQAKIRELYTCVIA